MNTAGSGAFLRLSRDEQFALLRAEKAAVTLAQVDAFWSAWQHAARDYGPTWRVQAHIIGAGAFAMRADGAVDCLLDGGAASRPAHACERYAIRDAIRAGALQLEVHRGAGLLGATGPYMVLHQATGTFRPFTYGGFVLPSYTDRFQRYPHDAAQKEHYS